MRLKNIILKIIYRLSPGLRKVAQDRATFASELVVIRAEKSALENTIYEQKAYLDTLVSEQIETNQSLIEKGREIESLKEQARSLHGSLAEKDRQIEASKLQVVENERRIEIESEANKDLLDKLGVMDARIEVASNDAASATSAAAHAAKASGDTQAILNARVVELIDQLKRMDVRKYSDLAIASPNPATPEIASASRRRAKFVVFSNPRSGSTWLETMLGLLPGVFVDYELKWGVTYAPGDIHAVLGNDRQSVSQLLEEMDTDATVTGSKFVFDILGLTPLDFKSLTAKIGPDVRIIHLTRNYRDVFLSVRRGYHHSPVRTETLTGRLRGALESADIRHAAQGTPAEVHPLACLNELKTFLDNDIHIRSLKAAGFPYLNVSYDKVAERLAEIADFAGAESAPEIIADVLARPAVAKLPDFDSASLISNLSELDPLFESFEVLRRKLILD